MGKSQIEDWGYDEDDDENGSEVVIAAGSARERVQKGGSTGTAGEPASDTRLTELLSGLKCKNYVTICEHLEAEGMVGVADQRVAGLLREWFASRMTSLNKEI